MAFDSTTRGKLQRFVAACRKLLTDEFDDQLQSLYGIYAKDGRVLELDKLASLDDDERAIGALLRERIAHLQSGLTGSKTPLADAVQRVLREQAFTLLNRFAALRMAEERELVLQCVGDGLNSKGFQVFENVASPDLGSQYERYRVFLDCLFDELSLDLGVLFDRYSPFGLLFPREPKLKDFLALLNDPELKSLWREDETIGWIYQYFNGGDVKEMRDAAKGGPPRNSREMAVRNQFFTPRYVVEFLTDNTLGRLWYEMTRGETALRDRCRYLVRRTAEIFLKPGESAPETAKAGENVSQEELLRQSFHIPHRPLKDPREIRLLDPACGSMHFGLYAFDLFTVIYDEAWEIAHGTDDAAKSAENFAPFVTFAVSFADKAAFLREVPRLIVEHNIHGIDIDPRAAQIAGLSLWLRAQRAWHQAGVKPANRPRITRSNIVCAEPMPGEKELLREFVEQQFPAGERPAFAFLLEKIVDRMTLAGEAGSLLRIEEEIRAGIGEAKSVWREGPKHEQAALFPEATTKPGQGEMRLDLSGITDEQFWARAEQRIYDALRAYAEQAENGGGFQRRLFADDAAQGFAFVDLCRKRYDVVVMNPPFGEPTEQTREVFKRAFPSAADNVAVCFLLRGEELLLEGGITSSITDCSWAKKFDYNDFRSHVLVRRNLRALAHLGWGVLDNANVETNVCVRGGAQALAFVANLSAKEDKGEILEQLIAKPSPTNICFYPRFERLPNNVFAFEMGETEYGPYEAETFLNRSFMVGVAGIKSCNSTADFRCWWEAPTRDFLPDGNWCLLHNGSPYCPLHYPVPFAVRSDQGRWTQIMANGGARPGEAYYAVAGLAYGKRTDNMYAYVKPAGDVFSQEGQAIFPMGSVTIWGALAVANSSLYNTHVNYVSGQHKYHNYINKVCLDTQRLPFTSEAARQGNQTLRALDVANEITHSFSAPHLCPEFSWNLSEQDRSAASAARLSAVLELRSRIDAEICAALGVTGPPAPPIHVDYFQHYFSSTFDSNLTQRIWLSYAMGVGFGRWDIRYATGERPAPKLPDPFAPLPVCPPGMLQGDDGLPLSPEAGRRLQTEGLYPLDVAWDGILVDDPEHPLDIERRVHAALAALWGDRADALEHEACALLGVPTLREWFRRPAGFFADHLKRYSKSRRQAPIYWPLSTASGSYTLWIYYHRLSTQTLYTCVTDFVKPKLEAVTADANRLQAKTQTGGTAKERAELQELRDFQVELQELHDELLRVVQLPWKPNLNDGVLVTASPLWKLFRLTKWQKDLKACWDELVAGEYDWAHLAMAIRPTEVREKCKKHRSIAVAHGLESICQVAAKKTKSTRKAKADELAL